MFFTSVMDGNGIIVPDLMAGVTGWLTSRGLLRSDAHPSSD
jgi:hypothetical protein